MYRISRSIIATVLVAFVSGACGTAAPSPAPTSTPASSAAPTNATPAPSLEPVQGIDANRVVTLGAWIAQTGPLASAASCLYGAQLKMDEVNAAGGVNGYTFKYNVIDDAYDPTKTVAAAQKLWEQDKVFAMVSPYGSGPLAAVKQYIVDNNVPVFAPWANSVIYAGVDGNTVLPNVFGIQASYLAEVKGLAAFAAQAKGFKNVAVLHTTDEYGQTGSDGLNAAAPDLGLTVVGDFGYDTTETNFAPLGQRAAASGADAILVWGIAGVTQVVNAAEQAGFTGTWLLGDVFRSGANLAQLTALPNMSGRSYLIFHQKLSGQMADEGSTYVADYSAKYPTGDPDVGLNCWTAMSMFMQGVQEATANDTPLTWDGMRSAFETWNSVDIGAAVGLSYSSTRHLGAEAAQILVLGADNTWEVAQDFQPLPK